MPEVSHERWEEVGRELFGEDKATWRFVCPNCGKEMSIAQARAEHADELPRLRERKYAVEMECIGRHLPGVGCDWAAYGLFSGPVLVGALRQPVFDFAGRPFTGARE